MEAVSPGFQNSFLEIIPTKYVYLLYNCQIKSQQTILGNQTQIQCITAQLVQQTSICISPVLINTLSSNEDRGGQNFLFDIDYTKLVVATSVS